ncbi:MAG: GAF domain-containing protein, partial [Rubricoccaceae bacterium]|nr:GAF domain-containing protein [Rubricoccaceae bacterium]
MHFDPVPFPSSTLNRVRSALSSKGAQRLIIWLAAIALFVGITFSHFWYALLGTSPDTVSRTIINGGAVGFAALIYLLLSPLFEQREVDPLRTLWRALLLAAGLLLATLVARILLGEWQMDSSTALPDDLQTAIGAALVAVLETLFAVIILHSLRPLVLFRRSRTTRRFWVAMLVLMGLSALTTAPVPANAGQHALTTIVLLLTIFLMVYCAFRLSWIVRLTFRHKFITILFTTGLATLIGIVLFMRFAGFGSAEGTLVGERIPAIYLYSRSLGALITSVLVFGFLYGATAVLSLVFHLPTTQAYAQQSGEIRAFKALAELSNNVLDRDQLVTTISGAPVRAGIADYAWLAIIDSRSGSLAPKVAAAAGISREQAARIVNIETLVSDTASTGEPLVLGTALADHRIQARPGDQIGSLVALPMIAGGESHGALFAAKKITDGFEADDVGALEGFANQAALALSHASLFRDALEKERMARELALAREVQQRLLPQSLPQIKGADIAVVEHPAHEIAGDYYDVVDLRNGCYGILVA